MGKWYVREWLAFKDGLLGISAVLLVVLVCSLAALSVVALLVSPPTALGLAAVAFLACLVLLRQR